MAAQLKKAACSAGECAWGVPPADAGDYDSSPGDTNFFSPWQSGSGTTLEKTNQVESKGDSLGNYASDYGKFFLQWYSAALIAHGDLILAAARKALGNSVSISAKVAGIHW